MEIAEFEKIYPPIKNELRGEIRRAVIERHPIDPSYYRLSNIPNCPRPHHIPRTLQAVYDKCDFTNYIDFIDAEIEKIITTHTREELVRIYFFGINDHDYPIAA